MLLRDSKYIVIATDGLEHFVYNPQPWTANLKTCDPVQLPYLQEDQTPPSSQRNSDIHVERAMNDP